MAFDDVEKRLNSSLDDLIASSKKAGAGRGGRVRDCASISSPSLRNDVEIHRQITQYVEIRSIFSRAAASLLLIRVREVRRSCHFQDGDLDSVKAQLNSIDLGHVFHVGTAMSNLSHVAARELLKVVGRQAVAEGLAELHGTTRQTRLLNISACTSLGYHFGCIDLVQDSEDHSTLSMEEKLPGRHEVLARCQSLLKKIVVLRGIWRRKL